MFKARRTRTSSNGGRWTFRGTNHRAWAGFSRTWSPRGPSSARRPGGGVSNIQSAWPFSTEVTCASASNPNSYRIASGAADGCAASDQGVKYGLRSSTRAWFGSYAAIRYGPLPGTAAVPASWPGAASGRMLACGRASFCRNSGSSRVSVMATVSPSARTPGSVQATGAARQASAPSIAPKKVAAVGLPTRKMRRNEATTSAGRTAEPSENRTPGRSWNR